MNIPICNSIYTHGILQYLLAYGNINIRGFSEITLIHSLSFWNTHRTCQMDSMQTIGFLHENNTSLYRSTSISIMKQNLLFFFWFNWLCLLGNLPCFVVCRFSSQSVFFFKNKCSHEYHKSVKQLGSSSCSAFCWAWSGFKLFAKAISRRH